MPKKELAPGTIIFVDSNNCKQFNCFGVIVDTIFWHKAVKAEKKIIPRIKEPHFNEDNYQMFRVLGNRIFSQYWKSINPIIGSFGSDVWHYYFQNDYYVSEVNLRPIIEQSKIGLNRVGELLLSDERYVQEALTDAEIVYKYLDGARFKKSKQKTYISYEKELLKLLKKAIPL